MAICKLCNHENPDDSQFCANCGNNLQSTSLESEKVEETKTEEVKTEAPEAAPAAPSETPAGNQPEILAPVTAEVVSQTPAVVPIVPPTGAGAAQQPYVAAEGPNSQHFEGANAVPFNTKDQAAYAQKMLNPNKPDYENVCVLALVFGFLGFFFNPLYLISLTAIILGIIGHANQGSKKTLGMVGWILGLASLCCQLFFDLVCAAATCGWGSIVFCF